MNYTRRGLLTGIARALAEGVPESCPRPPALPPFLRPPGAIDESAFHRTCTRCTDCLDACPHQAIRRLGPEFGEQAGTPAIIPEESPCLLCEDLPCIAACTTAALQPVPRRRVRMGTARIDLDRCYLAMGQPCDYCLTRCPLKREAIDLDDRGLPKIHDANCTGCGVCQFICPAPRGAVTVTPAHT